MIIPIYLYHQFDDYRNWYVPGVAGVCLFFALSGFLNAYRYYDRDLNLGFRESVSFGINKMKRIYPLHIILLILSFTMYSVGNIAAMIAHLPHSAFTSLIKLVLNAFLVSDWVPHIAPFKDIVWEYNIVTWFLSACLLFYILTPSVIRCMHKIYDSGRISPFMIMLIIFSFVIVQNLLVVRIIGGEEGYWWIYECPLSRIGDYLLGMQLVVIYTRRYASITYERGKGAARLLFMALLLFCILIVAGVSLYNSPLSWIVSTGFYFSIPTCMLILSIMIFQGDEGNSHRDNVLLRVIGYVGDRSAYIYLIHVPVINLVHGVYKRIGEVNIWIWSVISVIITLLASELYRRMIADRYKHMAPADR